MSSTFSTRTLSWTAYSGKERRPVEEFVRHLTYGGLYYTFWVRDEIYGLIDHAALGKVSVHALRTKGWGSLTSKERAEAFIGAVNDHMKRAEDPGRLSCSVFLEMGYEIAPVVSSMRHDTLKFYDSALRAAQGLLRERLKAFTQAYYSLQTYSDAAAHEQQIFYALLEVRREDGAFLFRRDRDDGPFVDNSVTMLLTFFVYPRPAWVVETCRSPSGLLTASLMLTL